MTLTSPLPDAHTALLLLLPFLQFMGQQINIIEGTKAQMTDPPKGMPKCSKPCIFNFAPFTPAFAKEAVAPQYMAPANSSLLP
jgi:hypothetical protein